MLFAIYVDWVTECLQEGGKEGEPSMLMYADDMQVWADTREGLEAKMRVVWQALDDVGMEISWKKTAVQANQWARELREYRSCIAIMTTQGLVQLPISEQGTAVRYLGIWMDADMQSREGRDRLERKIQNKIKHIESFACNPMTRVMLLKSSIVSLINYSAGMQEMGMEWCENMDKMLYKAITKGRGGMQMCRRDLTYQDVVYGGLGMMSIAEQYKVNRARVVAGLIEAGSRQQQRGQKAWAKDLLIQDIARREPLLPIIQEFKAIMQQVGVEVIYKPETQEGQWSSQRMKISLGEERIMKHMQPQHLIYGGGQRVKWLQGKETNLRVISWFEKDRSMGKEELAQSVTQYVAQREIMCEHRQWIGQGGIKMAGAMVMQLVNQMGREVKEMTLGLESGTGLEWFKRRQVGSL